MRSQNKDATSRREFLRRATSLAGLAACSGPFFLFPDRAEAGRKKLRILQWKHFVPGYDKWFDEVLAKEWGERHDTKVIVDHVDVEKLHYHAAAEAALRKGHDLVMFPSPPAAFEKDVIDHREILGRCGTIGAKPSSWPISLPSIPVLRSILHFPILTFPRRLLACAI